jgi:hypothetical protein
MCAESVQLPAEPATPDCDIAAQKVKKASVDFSGNVLFAFMQPGSASCFMKSLAALDIRSPEWV